MTDRGVLCVGEITGAQGLKGWLRVFSHMRQRQDILSLSPWMLDTGSGRQSLVVSGRMQGSLVLAKLAGIQTREQAEAFIGSKIYIRAEQFPKLNADEYYWSDLIGLQVESLESEVLGRIDDMLETGADDVMVVRGERERLIPFVLDKIVREVDLSRQRIIVDWQADY